MIPLKIAGSAHFPMPRERYTDPDSIKNMMNVVFNRTLTTPEADAFIKYVLAYEPNPEASTK